MPSKFTNHRLCTCGHHIEWHLSSGPVGGGGVAVPCKVDDCPCLEFDESETRKKMTCAYCGREADPKAYGNDYNPRPICDACFVAGEDINGTDEEWADDPDKEE